MHLTLGSHQLEGKLVPLKKPLALLDFTADNSDTDGTAQRCEASGHAAKLPCSSEVTQSSDEVQQHGPHHAAEVLK